MLLRSVLTVSFAVIASVNGLVAQDARNHDDVFLNTAPLAELSLRDLARIPIVSAARREQDRVDSPRSVSVVTGEEIRRRNFRTVPEAVASVAGVYLQQTNYAAGSPIIRGMVGNRILLLVNGNRLNNGTYRFGPNQYLNFIDINRVERIEVVRGAGSVLYGSGAFGGVINVITKPLPNARSGAKMGGSIHVRAASADESGVGRIELSGAKGPISILTDFSREGFGDLRSGRGVGLQVDSGYSQSAGSFSVRYAIDENKTLEGGLGRLKQYDVPRTDLLRTGSDLKYMWTGEGRDFSFVRYSQTPEMRYLSSFQITFAYQHPFEDLDRITAADRMTESFYRDSVRTYTTAMQLSSNLGPAQLLTYGVETSVDQVHSGRLDLNLLTRSWTAKTGLYPDQSKFSSIAFYVQDEMRLAPRVEVVLGLRHDRFATTATVDNSLTGKIDVNSSPNAVTASGQLIVKATKQISFVGGVSQGFRAPNLDDTAILGGSSRFEIPNDRLEPEHSINSEVGVRLQGRVGQVSLAVFNDSYRNLIDRAPATLAGLSFVDVNRNGRKDSGEPDVWQRQNISRAKVHGVEFESIVTVAPGWTWTHTMTWTRGDDTTLSVPLTRIPPFYGGSRITWQANRKLWIEGALNAQWSQHRLSPGDKTDIRIGPNGTAGFGAANLRAGLSRTALAGLSIALENVTNKRYRFHGSGIDRPGVNLIVGYTRSF